MPRPVRPRQGAPRWLTDELRREGPCMDDALAPWPIPPYYCTLGHGHQGLHLARDAYGRLLAAWRRGAGLPVPTPDPS